MRMDKKKKFKENRKYTRRFVNRFNRLLIAVEKKVGAALATKEAKLIDHGKQDLLTNLLI